MSHHYDTDEVRRIAVGRWPDILSRLGGVSTEILDGGHHPCPLCGGTDRFRLIDASAGALLCNQCGRNNGDGFASLSWLTKKRFPFVLKDVAEYLGVRPSSNGNNGHSHQGKKGAADPSANLKFGEWSDILADLWCRTKPVISPAAVQAIGGQLATYRGAHSVVAIPVYGEKLIAADPCGWHLYHAGGRELPIYGKTPGAPPTYKSKKLTAGSQPGWIGHVGQLAAASAVWITEGPSDLLALVTAGLPDGQIALSGAHGAGEKFERWMLESLRGKTIYICHDRDVPGEEGAAAKAKAVAEYAAEVRIVNLPYPRTPDHGHDLREFLGKDGKTVAELLDLVAAAEPIDKEAAVRELKEQERPKVIIGVDEHRVVNEAMAGLCKDQSVFRRGSMLVGILRDTGKPKGIKRPPNSPRISQLPLPIIRERLAANVEWVSLKITKEGSEEIPAHPPMWAVNAIASRGQWDGIRTLEGIVEFPAMRHDGTVIFDPGYDETTALYFDPNCNFLPVSGRPTIDDAKRSMAELFEVVSDFPFEQEHHKSAWLASVISPFVRFAYDGPTPLFLVEANTPGTGKSLLCDVTGAIVCGRPMSRMSYPNEDDEMRKNITATALAGDRLVLIDNIASTLGLPSLDAALTGTTWRDRMLGRNETTGDIPLTTIWYATGNNVVLVGDVARRICHIRLSSTLENPEERTNFSHPNLIEWVMRERGRLAAACLTIVRAYLVAGCPNQSLTPWGSYEGWSGLVRSAIVWAGACDPAAAKRELTQNSDRNASTLRSIIFGLDELDPLGTGMPISKMIKILESNPEKYETLRNAFAEVCGKGINLQRLGMKFHHLKGRFIEQMSLDKITVHNTAHWFIKKPNDKKQNQIENENQISDELSPESYLP